MKQFSRILSALLVLALLLSLAPMALAADTVTMTFVTPAGSKNVTVTAGGEYTFTDCNEEYEGYVFICWVTQQYAESDGSDIEVAYYEGDVIAPSEDMTLYALYARGELVALEEPCYYLTEAQEDYTGLWALVGFDYDYDTEDYNTDEPIALGAEGEEVNVINDLGATYDADYYEFYTADLSIQYEITRQSNGTYTVKNSKSGKYLSCSNGAIAMVTTPNAYSYWNITLDDYGYELISNAANSDLVLYYDDEYSCFYIFDDTESLFEDEVVYPSEYFYIYLFAYADIDLSWEYLTTQVGTCEHARTELRGVKEATCTESGYTGDTYCVDCGAKLATGTAIPAKGHSFGAWTVTKPATETEKGVETRTCTVCGATENRDIPVLDGTDPAYDVCHFTDFSDCKSAWYHEAVDFTVEEGLMEGIGDGKFDPNGRMTRAMIVTVLYRAMGEPAVAEPSTFTDVPTNKWYSDAIAWAQDNGIVKGVSDTKFAPNVNVTREQIATILWRYEASPKATADMSAFKDTEKISSYAADAMVWAVAEGILKGDSGNLKPLDSATRAEFACIIMRYLGGSYNCENLAN